MATAETTIIQTRISKNDKYLAELVCDRLGLSLNDAFRLFTRSIINTRSVPLDLTLPADISRDPTVQELKAIDNFVTNPQLLTVAETKDYLESLKNMVK
jgi:addiction module RelB/DinJ family antitoxin